MDRQLMLKVLVPVGGLALLLVLVGAVIALSNMEPTAPSGETAVHPSDDTHAAAAPDVNAMKTPPADPPKLDFPIDSPDWKDVDAAAFPGLKYWDVKEGGGAVCPSLNARARLVPVMHYTGWLTNGSEFDSSVRSGKPLTLPLAQLIRGWQEGVPGMKVGGKRRLLIPGTFGYGARGSGSIPPNATLVFEMELLDIK